MRLGWERGPLACCFRLLTERSRARSQSKMDDPFCRPISPSSIEGLMNARILEGWRLRDARARRGCLQTFTGHPGLWAEVKSLVAAHDQASQFLESISVAETLAVNSVTILVTQKPGD